MNLDTQSFGRAIAGARKRKGISQKELAATILKEDGMPITPQYLNDIEHDRRSPSSDHLVKQFATVLEIKEDVMYWLADRLPRMHESARQRPSKSRTPSSRSGGCSTEKVTVRSIRDPSGRFPERPYYQERELDQMFEGIVVGFLQRRHGSARFPITTDELTILIEADVSDLDVYADLSAYGPDVEGVTEFVPGSKPRVAIAAALSETASRENRTRTTLAHDTAM